MLWTAIAAMQRTDRDLVSVVYTGDTDASKAQIIAKVKVGQSCGKRCIHFLVSV